ncbi:YadA-like family protein [Paraburkholderia sp. Cpub6]|uniref:YadA family autotransporter adhesin n=1 Tax=Paraburkholderia sp. Cpub6 TaxID=2723094 RepID=UPI0017DF1505|nr:YadA-like family protein [Paraburkholderia sp. Cpub6]MBB5459955.1 autotransporter adhesin [Paraburkholderia sp. Cpub6]
MSSLSTVISTLKPSHYVSINDDGVQGGNYNNDGATGTNAIAVGVNATAGGTNSSAYGNKANAAGNAATALGYSANATGANSSAMGVGSTASGDNATAVGAGAIASGRNSVSLGKDSVADEDNTVSLGSAGNERRLTNVAPGINPTDGVNMSQLQGVQNSLNNSINSVARKAYGGVAAATALTMIPDVDQGKTLSVGIGGASYQGYGATAIGFTARITSNLKVRAGVGISSAGSSYGVGASYQW